MTPPGMRSAFEDLRASLPELPRETLPEFLGELARLEAEARLRLTLPATPAATEDRLLDVREAALRLGKSTSQLYKTADEFTFTIRTGRALRFSSLGIDKWIARRQR